jgi:leader peptidase (prepilin peptidase) / N-methyltransferase
MVDTLTFIPNYFYYPCFFILGVIVGSFLNVYLYRFHTNKSLMGSSHCLSCATLLRPYDLVPLLSYLVLRGKCRACHSSIPSRYFLVELATGLLFLLVSVTKLHVFLTILFLILVSLLVMIVVYDLYHMIIPDELTLGVLFIALIYNLYLLLTGATIVDFYHHLLGGVSAFAFFFLLWRVSGGRWIGFGDVKLVFPLSLLVGYSQTFSLVVVSFWIGALCGLFLLFLQFLSKRGQYRLLFLSSRLTIMSAVPFAPFLILSYLAVHFGGLDVVSLLTYG